MYKLFFKLISPVFLLLMILSGSVCFAANTSGFSVADRRRDTAENSVTAEEILKKADEARAPWPDFTMTATLSLERAAEHEADIFRVFLKNHSQTLVSYIEPLKKRGNMLLMRDDNLWYYVKKTHRPIRITPIQKLSGGASYGDITKLDWSKDYSAILCGESLVRVKEERFDAWFLKLTARSKSATYHTIDLYVEKGTCYPRKAVVYLQSGKKMKTMYFTAYTKNAGKIMNTEIDFIDHLASDKETSLIFSKVIIKKVPDSFFLPSSLPSLYSEVVY